jgi:hypothetical protein
MSRISRKIGYFISLVTLPTVIGSFISFVFPSQGEGNVTNVSFVQTASADIVDNGCGCGAGSCGSGGAGSCGGP